MKVWMLTGDKGSTAREIGIQCGLLEKQSLGDLLRIDEDNEESVI
jgi:magnesium-transporting ATPase (P-type)